jgi:hypothetical protein
MTTAFPVGGVTSVLHLGPTSLNVTVLMYCWLGAAGVALMNPLDTFVCRLPFASTFACAPLVASVTKMFEPVTAHAPNGNTTATMSVTMIVVS